MGKELVLIRTNIAIYTLHLDGVEVPQIFTIENKKKSISGAIYQINSTKDLTIEEYFKKWERLILELRKLIYD